MSHVPPDDGPADDAAGRLIAAIESGAVAFLFILVVLMALAKLLLERFGAVQVGWADEIMSALLLWLVMVGSAVAAGQLEHFRVRAIESLLSARRVTVIRRVVFLAAALVSLVLVWYGLQAVLLEVEFRQVAFGRVPVWAVQMIVPAGFAVMGARFLAFALVPLAVAVSRHDEGSGE